MPINHAFTSLAIVTLLLGCGDGGGGAASGSAAKPASSAPAKSSAKPSASAAAAASVTAAPTASASASASAEAAGSDAIKKMLEDVQTNEANYKDKPLKVDGLYLNTNSMSSGGKKTFNIVVADSKEDKDNTLTCELGESEPKDLKQWDAVTIEGKGSVSNVTKGDKKLKSLSVAECKVTKK